MKIALVYDMIYPFNVGGAEIRNYQLAQRLAASHEVHLFGVKFWDGPDVIERDGLIMHGVCRYGRIYNNAGIRTIGGPMKFALKLFFPLIKEKFDIIDASTFAYFHCFTCKAVSFFRQTPLIFTWHQYWGDYWHDYAGKFKGGIGRLIERMVLNLSCRHIAVSETTRRQLIRAGISASDIAIIYNGIDDRNINNIADQPKQHDVLFAGRLTNQKNLSLLIEAIKILTAGRPKIRAVLIGDGPAKPDLLQLVDKLDLKNNIFFTGFMPRLDDVYRSMKQARIFVSPSLLEGFGLAVAEANACGLPAVIVDNIWNASWEIIIDSHNGLIVDNDPNKLAEAIGRLLVDDDFRGRLSVNAIISSKRFGWDRIAEQLENYYSKVAKSLMAK